MLIAKIAKWMVLVICKKIMDRWLMISEMIIEKKRAEKGY